MNELRKAFSSARPRMQSAIASLLSVWPFYSFPSIYLFPSQRSCSGLVQTIEINQIREGKKASASRSAVIPGGIHFLWCSDSILPGIKIQQSLGLPKECRLDCMRLMWCEKRTRISLFFIDTLANKSRKRTMKEITDSPGKEHGRVLWIHECLEFHSHLHLTPREYHTDPWLSDRGVHVTASRFRNAETPTIEREIREKHRSWKNT